jgi:hypothetical protein
MRRLLLLLPLLLLLALPAQAQEPHAVYLPLLAQAELMNLSPAQALDEPHVRSVRVQRPSTSYWYLIGEVVNPTAEPLFSVELTAHFLDARGQQIAVEQTYATFSRIGPGQRSPFQLYYGDPSPRAAAFTLTISDRSASSVLAYRDALVLSKGARDNFGVEIFGNVRNPEVLELRGVEVTATFYDLAGQVVDVASGYTSPANVAPGATAPYALPTFDKGLTFARYEVRAQGYLAP